MWWMWLAAWAVAWAGPDLGGDSPEAVTEVSTDAHLPPRWGGGVALSTAFVAGPINPGLSGRTLDGTWQFGSTFNPRLDVGLSLVGRYRLTDSGWLTASWSARRDILLVDTTAEGWSPGIGGTTSTTVVDTSDIVLAFVDPDVVASARHDVHLSVAGRLTVPASYRSLVCDPLITALGASVGAWVGLGPVARLSVDVGADRLFHAWPAAPRGRCGVPLRGDTTARTLGGEVTPTPYQDAFAAGAVNPAWAADTMLSLSGWHGLFGLIPGVADRRSFQRVVTDLALGARLHVGRKQPEASVATLSGPVVVPASRPPAVWSFPWSVGVGVRATEHLLVRGALSNAAPQLAYDPSARLRVLPATTTVSLSVAGSW